MYSEYQMLRQNNPRVHLLGFKLALCLGPSFSVWQLPSGVHSGCVWGGQEGARDCTHRLCEGRAGEWEWVWVFNLKNDFSFLSSEDLPAFLLLAAALLRCSRSSGASKDKVESSLVSQRRLRSCRNNAPSRPLHRRRASICSPLLPFSVGSALGDLLLFNRSVLGRSSLGADLPGAAAGVKSARPRALLLAPLETDSYAQKLGKKKYQQLKSQLVIKSGGVMGNEIKIESDNCLFVFLMEAGIRWIPGKTGRQVFLQAWLQATTLSLLHSWFEGDASNGRMRVQQSVSLGCFVREGVY